MTRKRFHYPNYGTPEGYPDLRAHSGQMVTITAELGDDRRDPEVGRMFDVVADDGYAFVAREEELGPRARFLPHDPAFCGCKR